MNAHIPPQHDREPDVPAHRTKLMTFAAEPYAPQGVAAGPGHARNRAEGFRMRRGERYRCYARECLRLAQLVGSDIDKALFLQMAESWQRLAERAEAQMAHHDEQDE